MNFIGQNILGTFFRIPNVSRVMVIKFYTLYSKQRKPRMPKRKSYARPSRPFKRRRLFRKKTRRGRNAVPRVLRSLVEKKVYGTSGTDADVGSNGHFMYLNAPIAQGDQVTQREGRKITITNLKFRAMLQSDLTANTINQDRYVRFIVFIDKTPNQETMTVGDLLNSTGTPITSFRTWNESFRYKVLKDVTVHLPLRRVLTSLDVESNTSGSKLVKFNIPMKMGCEWLSTTGGTDQITRNSIGVLAISNQATSRVEMDWVSRVTFLDM